MLLKVLGSSSSGNCYLLQDKTETLIIECGIKWSEVKKALSFNLSSVCGCLITHEHKDHCKYVNEVVNSGIDVYLTKGTLDELGIDSHRTHIIKSERAFKVGRYKILPFETKHDAKEPVGFLIRHKDVGTLLFSTDTYYLEYKFDNLNHILVECNYSSSILSENVDEGVIHPTLRKRILKSHFELGNVKEFMKCNDLKDVRNIVLLHLSSQNSYPDKFKTEIEELTGKNTYIAKKGLVIDLSLYPF